MPVLAHSATVSPRQRSITAGGLQIGGGLRVRGKWGRLAPALLEALEARGPGLREVEMTSGIALIVRQGRGWVGAADPRREGTAGGD